MHKRSSFFTTVAPNEVLKLVLTTIQNFGDKNYKLEINLTENNAGEKFFGFPVLTGLTVEETNTLNKEQKSLCGKGLVDLCFDASKEEVIDFYIALQKELRQVPVFKTKIKDAHLAILSDLLDHFQDHDGHYGGILVFENSLNDLTEVELSFYFGYMLGNPEHTGEFNLDVITSFSERTES